MTVEDFIKAGYEAILADWLSESDAAASARGLTQPELRNLMPTYLMWLGDKHAQPPEKGRALVEAHISSRLRLGFDLSEVVNEFSVLARCIAKRWEGGAVESRPSVGDVQAMFAELHSAAATVTELYTQHMGKDEQSEKRYLRELQTCANQAMAEGDAPSAAKAQAMMDIVREALGADMAALMLYEPDTKRLHLAAFSGAGERDLQEYAATGIPTSFVSQVAASTQETTADVQTTELTVSETLRAAGIQSLLGVRLPEHYPLIGIMYVGLRERRAFTAREVSRIEALGQRLVIHLQNARLFADVREQVKALERERALREDLVAVLAHDLRGPLSSARLMAQRLAMHPEKLDERRDWALKIQDNIDRTDRMIRDLLDASRVRAGEGMSLHLAECDLVAIARDVIDALTPLHGPRFVLHPGSAVTGVWSTDELHRSLWNLATNALKYGAPDTPIEIAVRPCEGGAEFCVHNKGVPIPPEEQPALFDRIRSTNPWRRPDLGVVDPLGDGA